jgi:hypothetical protein
MWTCGVVKTDGGVVLASPALTIGELLNCGLPVGEKTLSNSGGKIIVGPMLIDGYEVVAAVNFKSGRLWFVKVELNTRDRSKLLGIDDNGRVPLTFYERWIEGKLGTKPPVTYGWGKIVASEDHWTLDTSLLFMYENV